MGSEDREPGTPRDIQCPHCEKTFPICLRSQLDKGTKLTIRAKGDGDLVSAEVVGGVVMHTTKLLKALAKEHGAKLHPFVSDVSLVDGEFTCSFVFGVPMPRKRRK